jgi:hypothetical protein
MGRAVAFAFLALAGGSDGTIGPGDAHTVVHKAGYRIEIAIAPNRGALIPSTFTVGLTRAGKPVRGTVTARFAMIAMPMPALSLRFSQVAPGRFTARGTKLTMPGRWRITFHVVPRESAPVDVVLVDTTRVI